MSETESKAIEIVEELTIKFPEQVRRGSRNKRTPKINEETETPNEIKEEIETVKASEAIQQQSSPKKISKSEKELSELISIYEKIVSLEPSKPFMEWVK